MENLITATLFGKGTIMKRIPQIICPVLFLVLFFLLGCDNGRYELVTQVDQLIASPTSEWVDGKDGKFYHKIPNGSIRVKADGSVDLITELEGGKYSSILVSYPDGTRAARVAKRFGINKLSPESIDRSSQIQAELMKDAIVAISNSMKSSVVFESPDEQKDAK